MGLRSGDLAGMRHLVQGLGAWDWDWGDTAIKSLAKLEVIHLGK